MFEEKYTLVYLWIIMSSSWPCRHTSGFELAPVAGGKKDVSQVDQVWPVGKFGLFQRSLSWRAGICLSLRNLPRYRWNQQFHGKSVGPRAKRCQMDSPLGLLGLLGTFQWYSPMKDTKRIPKFQVCACVCFYGRLWSSLALAGELEDDVWRWSYVGWVEWGNGVGMFCMIQDPKDPVGNSPPQIISNRKPLLS